MNCCTTCENLIDLWNRGERFVPRLIASSGVTASALDKRLRLHGWGSHPVATLIGNERSR